jgi:Zn-dependent peptidase ImmA (M78 family)
MKQENELEKGSAAGAAPPSVLAALRAMAPAGQLTWSRALRLAEDQADRLLELSHITAAPVPDNIIRRLPRIQVRLSSLPTSGVTYWDGEHWIVGLNQTEPRTRRRFTLVHEYKHIVDHGRTAQLYAGDRFHSSLQQAERAADYFGGCVLMPRALVEEAWHAGLQTR